MFVDIMRRKIFILSVTIYLFLFSCIHFKEHPSDSTTLKEDFLISFLRNNSIDQDNNSIYQDNNSIYQEAKGILDDSFGNGSGYVYISGDNYGQSLAVQSNGKILLGGYCYNNSSGNRNFCIARFNSNGTLDTSNFSYPYGYILQPIGLSGDYGQSLAIQPDGKILMGGHCKNGSIYDFCIARFK